MTTPTPDPKSLAQITAATGLGAFVVGGGSAGGGSNWGQDINETFVKSLYELPAITTQADLLPALQAALERLPMEFFNFFKMLLPDLPWDTILDAATAAEHIIEQLIPRSVPQALADFQAWVTNTFEPLLGLVTQIIDTIANLLGVAGSGLNLTQLAQGFTNLFGVFNGATSLGGAGSFISGLLGNVGNVQTAINQIGDVVNGLVVTPINTAVSDFISWWNSITGTVSGHTTSIATANTNIAANSTSISTHGTMLQQLTDITNGALVTPINTEITNFQNWWNSVTGSINSHASSISALTTNHNNLLTTLFGSPTLGTSVIPAALQVNVGGVVASIETHIGSLVDGIVQSLQGGTTTGNKIALVKPNLLAIPASNVQGLAAAGVLQGAIGTGMAQDSSGTTSSMTLSGTITPAAADTMVIVQVGYSVFSSSGVPVGSVAPTCGGVAMTKLGEVWTGGNSQTRYSCAQMYMRKIPAGSAPLAISIPFTGAQFSCATAEASSYSASSTGTPGQSTGTATTAATPFSMNGTSASGHMLVQMFATIVTPANTTIALGSYSQSQMYQHNSGNSTGNSSFIFGSAAGAATVNFAATPNQTCQWAGLVVDLAN